jgi:rod shape-determining protein MreD
VSTRRELFIAFMLLAAFVFQIAVMPQFKILGVQPDLILVVAVVVAVQEGPAQGAIAGFAGGLLVDLVSPLVMGVGALSRMLAAYIAGLLKDFFMTYSILLPVILVFLASLAEPAMHQLALLILGKENLPPLRITTILFVALYNVIVVFVLYPLFKRFTFPAKEEAVALPKAAGK